LLSASDCFTEEDLGDFGTLDPDQLESYLEGNLNKSSILLGTVASVVGAIGGVPAEGVTLSIIGNVVDYEVAMDLDLDAIRETVVIGGMTFADEGLTLDQPATFRIDEIDHAEVDGSANATIEEIGTATYLFMGSAEFSSQSGPPVDLPEYAITVTPFANFVEGFADFEVAGISATAFFEADGQGGWQTRVVGEDFNFTI
jgi:hypothetical protein